MADPTRTKLLAVCFALLTAACSEPEDRAVPREPADDLRQAEPLESSDEGEDSPAPTAADDTVEATTDAIEDPREVEPLVPPARRARVTQPRTTRPDVDLIITPPGLSITVPFGMSFGGVMHGRALSRLRGCTTSYADVVDAALPAAAIAAHTQRDRFCQTVMVNGPHVRVYVLDEPVEHVARAIRAGASRAIAGLPHASPTSAQEHAQRSVACREAFPEWTHVYVGYDVGYGDYNEGVSMDFLLRRFGEHTVVVAVLHHGLDVRGGDESLEALIRSVRSAEPGAAPE